ncbi:MAG: multidrug effflux MFS transporter [Acidobacteria bacterium]|nr:multidrug effflux MFS transporter [Acidobacteriota bacterium]
MTNRRTYFRIIITLGFLIGLNPFSIDMYLPGFSSIAASLNTDVATVGLSLASFFAGICLGQLFYGPILDRFGRKKPLLIGLSIYLLASVGCAFVTSIEQLILLRFVQALGGCAGMVASRAMVRDIFPPQDNARVFSMLILVMGVAPIIAPSIGGAVVTFFDWHAIFIVLALITAAVMAAVMIFLPESKGPDPLVSLNPVAVVKGYFYVMLNRRFLLYTLALAFGSAALFGYITSSPFLFMEVYGLGEFQYSLAFSFCAFCLITGSQVNRALLNRMSEERAALLTGGILVAVTLILLSLMLLSQVHLAVVLACIAIFMFSLGIFNPNTSALAMTSVSHNIGMASAMTGFVQMGLSAVIAGMVSVLANGTTIPMTAIMFGCAVILLACVFLANSTPQLSDAGEPAVLK